MAQPLGTNSPIDCNYTSFQLPASSQKLGLADGWWLKADGLCVTDGWLYFFTSSAA